MHVVNCSQTFDAGGLPVLNGNSPRPWRKCPNPATKYLVSPTGKRSSICDDCGQKILQEYNNSRLDFLQGWYLEDHPNSHLVIQSIKDVVIAPATNFEKLNPSVNLDLFEEE